MKSSREISYIDMELVSDVSETLSSSSGVYVTGVKTTNSIYIQSVQEER
jgi:hypothetical protein